jgi:sugar/nucleoside kinase (ribokinase family)
MITSGTETVSGTDRSSVLVIGDVMTDIVVRPEGPLVHGADRRAAIRVLPGGSGANAACWLAREGVCTVFAGRVGADDHVHQSALLARHGAEAKLMADETLPTGTIVTLLSPDGERSFLTDRGANDRLCRADLPEALLDGVDLVHVSGYSLVTPGPRAAVLGLIEAARRRAIPFTVDPSSHSFLAEVGATEFLVWTGGAAVCFANAEEAAVLAGAADRQAQLAILTRSYKLVVIKEGSGGAIAASAADGTRWSSAASDVQAIDTTGAGDAFLAGFLAAYLRAKDVPACLRRGVALGSQAVARLGGRPGLRSSPA